MAAESLWAPPDGTASLLAGSEWLTAADRPIAAAGLCEPPAGGASRLAGFLGLRCALCHVGRESPLAMPLLVGCCRCCACAWACTQTHMVSLGASACNGLPGRQL